MVYHDSVPKIKTQGEDMVLEPWQEPVKALGPRGPPKRIWS